MTNPQDSVRRFPEHPLSIHQLDFGVRNHKEEAEASMRASRDRDAAGFPGDLCYPLDFLGFSHWVMENGLEGAFVHPPHEARAFR